MENNRKSVLITGASRGIGKAIALKLASEGYNLVLHCNKSLSQTEELLKTIQEKGVQGRIVQFDISQRSQCIEVLSKDLEENGIYYGVICNAGIAADNPFPLLSAQDWDSVINTNLSGFYNRL